MTRIFNTALRLAAATAGAAICLAAAAAPAAAAAAAAAAASPIVDEAPRVETVRHGDLNLASPAGQKRLEARLRAAARRVCDQAGASSAERAEEMQCVRKALEATAIQRLAATSGEAGRGPIG
jgi:UrcA family protein